MERNELLEHTAGLDCSETRTNEPVQAPVEEDDAPEVVELAGQVKEALAPVKAPPAVRDRLRDEVVVVAQRRLSQDVRVESPARGREWAVGAAIGSAMALIGWALHALRSRVQAPSEPEGKS